MSVVKILSFNIWFDEYHIYERLDSLLHMIEDLDPDILCLQEVTKNIYSLLRAKLPEYSHSCPDELPDERYSCIIMSKFRISESYEVAYDESEMGRKLLISCIDIPIAIQEESGNVYVGKKKIIVANTHFESVFKYKINYVKTEQFEIAHKILNDMYDQYSNVIFCADTNILEDEEPFFFNGNWDDAWVIDGQNTEKQFTFDSMTNHNLRKFHTTKYQNRLDRIIYRADDITQTSFDIIKDFGSRIQPSDHHPIYAEFVIS